MILTWQVRYLLFPALNISKFTWQIWQSFSPTLKIFLLAPNDSIKLFRPTLVIIRRTMMIKISDMFIHSFRFNLYKLCQKQYTIFQIKSFTIYRLISDKQISLFKIDLVDKIQQQKKIKLNCLMTDQTLYSSMQVQIYPLEMFILFVGFCIGVAITKFNTKNCCDQPIIQEISYSQKSQKKSSILKENPTQNSILSYSLSTGQSFQSNGSRMKLFKGHLYQYFHILSPQIQQSQINTFQNWKSGVTKIQKDGQWTKFYNSTIKIPKSGKHYFQIYVVRNEYFVKRQPSQKSSNVAVSRTDLIVGFILAKQTIQESKLNQQVNLICQQTQKQSNNIFGISAYGFNGRIYNNGELRTEQKIIKRNKVLTILINQDQKYIAYELQGETIGFSLLPKDRTELIPFIQIYAVGSSVIVSS